MQVFAVLGSVCGYSFQIRRLFHGATVIWLFCAVSIRVLCIYVSVCVFVRICCANDHRAADATRCVWLKRKMLVEAMKPG